MLGMIFCIIYKTKQKKPLRKGNLFELSFRFMLLLYAGFFCITPILYLEIYFKIVCNDAPFCLLGVKINIGLKEI